MNCVKRSMLVCMLAIALTTLLTAAVAEAAGLTSGKWSIVKSPNAGSDVNELLGVAAVSTTNVWAVGYYTKNGGAQTLIERWNGTSWKVVSSPNVGSSGNVLYGVAAVSATNVWAVGQHANTHSLGFLTLIEHWNGTSWQVVSSPNPGRHDQLKGVAAVSATNVWAVGGYINSSGLNQALIEHWNGTSWQVVSSPNVVSSDSGLVSVVAVSATNVWAAGDYANSRGVGQTLIEHWNGTSWQVVSSPNVAGSDTNSLYGVAAVSAHDIWAVGFYSPTPTGAARTLIEHWNGTNWQIVSSPNVGSGDNFLRGGVAAISTSDIWAVGNHSTSNGLNQTLIEHWNGTSWQVVSSPNVGSRDNFLLGVTRVPGSTSLWAVGLCIDSSGSSKTLTEFSG